MGATKTDLKRQRSYMMKNKSSFLAKSNPYRISLTEFNKRIATINSMLKYK